MTNKMKAIFKGRNGSCGFITGEIYDITLWKNELFSSIRNERIPYESIESFLNNWEIIPKKDLTKYYREQKLKRIE
jgi:hypothetical protein